MSEEMKKAILLVEDDFLIAMSEKLSLERYGYSVMSASSGENAVAVMHESSDIDIVLLDIDLGDGMDGTEAAGIILGERDVPIIFMSSHSEREIVEKTEKISSYGYVVKGSSITVLDAAIKMAFKLFEAKQNDRKREAILQETVEKYNQLFENAGVGIAYYTVDGVVMMYNRVASRNMKGVPEDFIGKSLHDLFPKDKADLYLERIRKAAASGIPATYENIVPAAIGEKFFSSTFTRIVDASGKVLGIQVASTDLTERKKAEDTLAENNAISRTIIDSMRELFWMVGNDGRILDVNNAYCEMSGYSKDELLAMSISDIVVDETPEETFLRMQQLKESGSMHFTSRQRKKNGELMNLDISLVYSAYRGGLYIGFGRSIPGIGS
jgi:PAS domain S-box-containing protein